MQSLCHMFHSVSDKHLVEQNPSLFETRIIIELDSALHVIVSRNVNIYYLWGKLKHFFFVWGGGAVKRVHLACQECCAQEIKGQLCHWF